MEVGKYKHYKGMFYEVIGECRHTETSEELVVYRSLYGNHELWVRPKEMFLETVEVNGIPTPRFEFVEK